MVTSAERPRTLRHVAIVLLRSGYIFAHLSHVQELVRLEETFFELIAQPSLDDRLNGEGRIPQLRAVVSLAKRVQESSRVREFESSREFKRVQRVQERRNEKKATRAL
jgi:hypothetical protein